MDPAGIGRISGKNPNLDEGFPRYFCLLILLIIISKDLDGVVCPIKEFLFKEALLSTAGE